jgi:photosystem II stability/assembly factor-like uncharacterized protein
MRKQKLFPLLLTLLSLGWALPSPAQDEQFAWKVKATGCDASLRGLSVVDERVLWASGAKAAVVRTLDGGETWQNCGPQGFAQLEFRSIAAFDDLTATIASAGTPAVILQTRNAGETWNEVFRHSSTTAFFDALRFWDRKRGIAFSDPVDGRILIVTTVDAGASWQVVASKTIPAATEKEGGFAASNSVLCLGSAGRAWIGTGGTPSATSRVYATSDFGQTWTVHPCPLASDTAAGIFSIAASSDLKLLLAVGGDYRPEIQAKQTAAFSRDFGQSWQPAAEPPGAFVSAVCFASPESQHKTLVFATGPTSSFASVDGNSWKRFSSTGFHALETSHSGRVFAVGSEGRFGELRMAP